jgi:hypothetical protein
LGRYVAWIDRLPDCKDWKFPAPRLWNNMDGFQRFHPRSLFVCVIVVLFALGAATQVQAQLFSGVNSTDDRFALENLLPPSVAETVDVNIWGWFSYLHSSDDDDSTYWLADISAGATKRFGDRLAVTVDMHFIDDNHQTSGFLEQAFGTFVLLPQHETLLTVGKFNASFGIEPRNAWDRLNGTTSLLFGAQPQDLIGVMITQPLGNTGFTFRPFLANGFLGHFNFDQAPSVGLTTEFHRNDSLRIELTNWIGPGVTPPHEDSYYGYGGNDSYSGTEYVVENWRGPNLYSDRAGVLYFLDGSVQWLPRPDLTLAAEGLLAVSDRADKYDWGGVMLLANFDITDRMRVFGRWSFLDDPQGLVTGVSDRRHEVSLGAGYQFIRGLELRGEYRHDFSQEQGMDSVSVHLTFGY